MLVRSDGDLHAWAGDICTASLRVSVQLARARRQRSTRTSRVHVAEAVKHLNLAHTVITSVNRDDLPDGGAAHWAENDSARSAHSILNAKSRVLIPDFNGDEDALNTVLDARA